MLGKSWIITRKATGEAVLETWNSKVAESINRDIYQVEDSYAYLCRFNREVKDGGR